MTQGALAYSDLREKTPDDLDKELEELYRQLITLRTNTAGASKTNQIANVRQSIARIHIVKNQTIKQNLREFYRDKEYKPKDLRPKQTRAMRRELTADGESSRSTRKQRKFAVKD